MGSIKDSASFHDCFLLEIRPRSEANPNNTKLNQTEKRSHAGVSLEAEQTGRKYAHKN